jgi:hypothetical protein
MQQEPASKQRIGKHTKTGVLLETVVFCGGRPKVIQLGFQAVGIRIKRVLGDGKRGVRL